MVKRRGVQRENNRNGRSYSPPEVNEYEPTDSENDMDDGEKLLLEKVRSGSKLKTKQKQMAIMDIPSSDEEDIDDINEDEVNESDDDEGSNMNSDIEGQNSDDDLPNQKAWGKKKRNYYDTDYVDKDYGGFDGEDAEAADMEEQESLAIQKRLAAELEGVDFSLDVFMGKTSAKQDTPVEIHETIKTDLSQMSAKEKFNLLTKEAPELPVIAEEFRSTMSDVLSRLQNAATLVRNGQVKSELLQTYIRSKLDLSLNYAINVVFYLTLRARRMSVASHPVVKRLVQYRDLLQKLKPLEPAAEKEIDKLLEMEAAGKLPVATAPERHPTNKGKLDLVAILKKQKNAKTKTESSEKETANKTKEDLSVTWEDEVGAVVGGRGRGNRAVNEDETEMHVDSDEDDDVGLPLLPNKDGQEETDEKRAITWQMAKNKGLTPRRKKEQRNPRVKHRNRFRKAKIRRKGQVREVRSETQKYGGEISGIKATVTKSVKFN